MIGVGLSLDRKIIKLNFLMSEITITPKNYSISLDLNSTVEVWLNKRVKPDARRAKDIKNDKSKAVFDFFDWIGKSPEQVLPEDVMAWQNHLRTIEKQNNLPNINSHKKDFLAPGTIYNRLSALSNYYEFLRQDAEMARFIPVNPARVTLPKAPGAFQSKSVKALKYEELYALVQIVEDHAATNHQRYLRDFAILQMYIVTGRRREEIISLVGDNIIPTEDRFIIRNKVKGGNYLTFEMNDPIAQNALFTYLEATNRGVEIFETNEPLWLRHSNGGRNLEKIALTSHGFSKNIKKYALEAGLKKFHIHQLRHTYAKIVSESSESMAETQEALGHSNIKTTETYVQRLAIKKDKFSGSVREALRKAKKS